MESGRVRRDGKIGLERLLGSVHTEGLPPVDVFTKLGRAQSVVTLAAYH